MFKGEHKFIDTCKKIKSYRYLKDVEEFPGVILVDIIRTNGLVLPKEENLVKIIQSHLQFFFRDI